MSVFDRTLDSITRDDIEALKSEGVREGQTLEYKETVDLTSKEAKEEFAKDISSFANTTGGDYILGIKAPKGVPEDIPGFSPKVSLDNFELQCQKIVRSWTKPPLPPLAFKAIPGFPNGMVVIIRVGRSYSAPHLPSNNDATPFYARRSNGKGELTVGGLRDVYLRTDAVFSRMGAFVDERLKLIKLTHGMIHSSAVVIHVLPLASFSEDFNIDVKAIRASTLNYGGDFSGSDLRYNYLGVRTERKVNHMGTMAEIQVFRTGQIEAIDYSLVAHPGVRIGNPKITDYSVKVSGVIDESLLEGTKHFLGVLAKQNVPPPVYVVWSVIGAGGNGSPTPFDHDRIVLPRVELQKLTFAEYEIAEFMRPALDVLYQSLGHREWHRDVWTVSV